MFMPNHQIRYDTLNSYLLITSTGADPKTIQALAGHGDIQITMNRYVDPSKQNLLKATETLESLLFSDGKVKDTTSAEPIAS